MPQRNVRQALAVSERLDREMIPTLDPAQGQIARDLALGYSRHQLRHGGRGHLAQNHQRLARQADIDQRFLRAATEAAGLGQQRAHLLQLEFARQRGGHLGGTGAEAAGAHAHRDAGQVVGQQLCQPGGLALLQRCQIVNFHLRFPPLARLLIHSLRHTSVT